MATRNERIKEMEEAYCRLRFDEGRSPNEIAEIFGLSDQTVYNHLKNIAEKSGYTREELLGGRKAKKAAPRPQSEKEEEEGPMPVAEEIAKRFETVKMEISEIREKILVVLGEESEEMGVKA